MSSIRIWLSNYLSWFTVPTFSITVTDVLEILILAFLVYSFLLWVKNTRAWTLLKGIMVLVICVSLVYLLHMDTLSCAECLSGSARKRSSLHCFRSIRTM